jgi:NAD(P)-dependent dehydrogenase (short-subunit alcohol dehydrogenase family)
MKKYALLTGAAGGIGQDISSALRSNGWFVINSDLPGSALGSHGYTDGEAWVNADLIRLTDPGELDRFYRQIHDCTNGSPISALINCAAVQVVLPFEDITADQWLQTISTNVVVPALLAKRFLSELKQEKGCIVNIGSIHSMLTKPQFSCYSTSKAALSGLTRALAVELGHQIRVNAIEPAAISTPMLEAGFAASPQLRGTLDSYHPTGYIGTTSDVSRAVLYLLDERNTFLNGCIIQLGGGIHSRLHDPS